MLVVVTDSSQALIASTDMGTATATITSNHNLVLTAGQFVRLELFAHRVNARIDAELLSLMDKREFHNPDASLVTGKSDA